MAHKENTNPENEDRLLRHRKEFIVEHQARIDANLANTTQQLNGLTEGLSGLAGIVAGLAQESAGVVKMVAGVTEQVSALSKIVDRHERKLYGE